MSIENLKTFDPFADAEADVDAVQLGGKKEDYVHIRIQRELPLLSARAGKHVY